MTRRAFGSLHRRGDKWVGRWTENGRRRKKTLGPATGPAKLTKAQAGKLLDKIGEKIQRGQVVGGHQTLRQFLDLWEPTFKARTAPETYRLRILQLNIAAEQMTKPMARIGSKDAEAYATWLARGRKVSTVRQHLAGVSVVWKAAIRHGIVSANPWPGVLRELQKPEQRAVAILDEATLARVLDATPAGLRPYVALIAWTGLRRGEAAALTWDDVDAGLTALTVRHSKARRPRHLRLLPEARAVLEPLKPPTRLRGPAPRIFDVDPVQAQRRFRRAMTKAGLPVRRLHDLRHNWTVMALRHGASIYDVSKALGHASVATTQKVYGDHLPDEGAARAIKTIEAARARAASRGRAAPSQS